VFDAIFTPQELLDELGDRAWLQAMLDAERALAQAEAEAGLIPAEAADAIAACCRADLFESERIARYVHYGATSQDIVDTAAMLVSRRALELVLADVARVSSACAALAENHRATPMVARTLLQQALPATFGGKAATWLVGILEAQRLVLDARDRLAVQLGGAAGTLAALGEQGPNVMGRMASNLGLAEPPLPWHTTRVRVAALGSALATLAGALGKIALDVVLMAQTEVGELSEPAGEGRGSSSTLAHKRNPIGSTLALAGARRAHAFATLLTGGLVQEHERAVGAWHAEWEGVSGVLAATGGAAANMAEVLDGLQVHSERMLVNLGATRGLILSERLVFALAERLGHADARALVSEATARATERGTALRDELAADRRTPLSSAELDAAFDPETYVGAADVFIDRALDLYRRS
jgi:3-carboxy-cis,cis-muconate cycloisomerase